MKLRDIATFVAFGLMVVGSIGYIGSLGVRVGPPSHRTQLSMKVTDTNNLMVDSNVLLRGVPVGKVTSINAALDGATIGFYIDGKYQVPVDSEVRLENLSALGESYIGLVPQRDGGPMFRDGQQISTERVVQPASISELATSTVRVLNQLDPEALQRISNEADAALPDPTSVLPNLSHASLLLRNVAANMNGQGATMLDNFQTLLGNADWLGPLLADLTPDVARIGTGAGKLLAGAMNAEHFGGPTTYFQFAHFVNRIQKLLDDRAADLKLLGEALLPHLKGIAGSMMNVDTGQILSNFLAAVPADGTVTLHVTVPPS